MCFFKSGEILKQVAQRSHRCFITESAQGQVGWSSSNLIQREMSLFYGRETD